MNPKNLKRIVVATDFSEVTHEAIETAIAFAQDSGALVDVVHVAPEVAYAMPPPLEVVALPLDLQTVMDDAMKRLAEEEKRILARGISCESNLLVGRSDSEIVAHADRTGSDLIILGTHGRSGLGHALLGSVAEKVVQHAHCPVLTVPQSRSQA
jgi:nucleotide-binding universal stress UspA family protein